MSHLSDVYTRLGEGEMSSSRTRLTPGLDNYQSIPVILGGVPLAQPSHPGEVDWNAVHCLGGYVAHLAEPRLKPPATTRLVPGDPGGDEGISRAW